jgi:Family of unknown function (DUF6515)
MKSIIKTSTKIAAAGFACSALFWALTPAAVQADRGRGSIRAAARPAPAPVRAAPPPREAPRPAPEARPDEHPAPPARVEAPPRAEPPPRRDWDDNDDDARSWGGYAHGVPAHIDRGQRFHDLPPSHRGFIFNNVNYYYDDDGAYYLQQPDGEYLVVEPPVGGIVPGLPDGTVPITVGPTTYYYLDGVFYIAQDDTFAVVNPPPGIIVPTLPTGASQAVIDGVVCYQFNGFNYQPSLQDGVTVYTVTPM